MGSERREGSQAQVRPCPGQEQNPCSAWVWQGWQTSGGRTRIGHTAHSLGLAGAHTGLPYVADLAAKCCILCHLVGISVLLLVFLTRFPSLTLAASSSSWDLRRLQFSSLLGLQRFGEDGWTLRVSLSWHRRAQGQLVQLTVVLLMWQEFKNVDYLKWHDKGRCNFLTCIAEDFEMFYTGRKSVSQ